MTDGDFAGRQDPWAPPPGNGPGTAPTHPAGLPVTPPACAPAQAPPPGWAAPAQYSPHGYAAWQMPWGGGYGWGPRLPTGLSVAALVVGLVSLLLLSTFWGAFLAIFSGPVAIGLGVSARAKCDRGRQGERGKATAGFVMGILATVGSALMVVLFVVVLLAAGAAGGAGSGGPSLDARGAPAVVVD